MTAAAVTDGATGARKGRPRDSRIDREITSAAVLVLADTGFSAFSVSEVALRAGVAKTTVYRRFPTRVELISAALERLNDDLPDAPPRGSVRRQLLVILEGIRNRRPDSQWSRILVHALGEGSQESGFAEIVQDRVLTPRLLRLRSVIDAGIASGELRSDLDPNTAIPILVGPMLYLGEWSMSSAFEQVTVEAVLDVLMTGMTPANES